MRLSRVFASLGMMVVATLMVATTPSFAAQRSAKNMRIAPAECGDSISEKLLDQAQSIVIKLNSKGEITFINEYAQKFFGFPERDIVGKTLIGTIAPKTESSGRDLQPLLEDVVKHPERHVTNINENIDRSGKRVLVSWVNLPLADKSGNILCIGNPIGNEREKGLAALLQKKR